MTVRSSCFELCFRFSCCLCAFSISSIIWASVFTDRYVTLVRQEKEWVDVTSPPWQELTCEIIDGSVALVEDKTYCGRRDCYIGEVVVNVWEEEYIDFDGDQPVGLLPDTNDMDAVRLNVISFSNLNAIGVPGTGGEEDALKYVRQYPAGSWHTCYYNPTVVHPRRQSVLMSATPLEDEIPLNWKSNITGGVVWIVLSFLAGPLMIICVICCSILTDDDSGPSPGRVEAGADQSKGSGDGNKSGEKSRSSSATSVSQSPSFSASASLSNSSSQD